MVYMEVTKPVLGASLDYIVIKRNDCRRLET